MGQHWLWRIPSGSTEFTERSHAAKTIKSMEKGQFKCKLSKYKICWFSNLSFCHSTSLNHSIRRTDFHGNAIQTQ